MIKPDLDQPLPETIGSVHFVGVGGSGMSGIARVFLAQGHRVTGSDSRESANVQALRDLGATIAVGHDAANVGDADTLVVTGALWQDNPEYQYALAHDIPVLHRSQALAWLIGGHRLVSVAGAHGKTTSTGMVITALLEAGRDPNFVNGGVIQSLGVSARGGGDDLFVIEADESDGSFLLYDTSIALITNVDADHLDHYGSREAFDQAFVEFASAAAEFVVISSDDTGAVEVTKSLDASRVVTFGRAQDADVKVSDVTSSGPVAFTLSHEGVDRRVQLAVPGHHNALNAAGAYAVLVGVGLTPEEAISGLEIFGGTQRRFELHGTVRGVSVYDDYAHHPTEVQAALQAARSVVGGGRLIAVHQPHLYSRTQMMAGEFADAYETLADHTVVLDVYGAREDPVPGVTGALVSERFHDASKVDYVPDWQAAADRVAEVARDGDFVITLGCGDVYRIVPQLLGSLERTEVAAAASPGAGSDRGPMKRPEGFDRVPPPRPKAEASPESATAEPTRAAAGDQAQAERSKTRAATSTATSTTTATRPAEKARPTEAPGPTREAEPADPAFLPARDTSKAEARQRSVAARRLARRARAARRAVERAEVRRFTRRSRHRRATWITAGAVAVVLVGSVTISVFSPLLSLQHIDVEGTSRVDRTAVLKSLDGQIGKPLATVDFTTVKHDLSNFPLIESYVTETRPPHTLVIRITEREPIASVKVGTTFELVDPAGIVISTSPKQPAGVPLVDIKGATVDGTVYRAAAEVLLSLPAQLRATVKTVSASTPNDVTLGLTTGEQVVWGGADSSTQKAQLLTGLIKSHKATNPNQSVEYDVSAPDNGIIRTK